MVRRGGGGPGRRVLASERQGQVPPGAALPVRTSLRNQKLLEGSVCDSSLPSSTARVPCPHSRFAEHRQRMLSHSEGEKGEPGGGMGRAAGKPGGSCSGKG